MKRKLLSLLTALALLIVFVPFVSASADGVSDEAYLMFADSSWTNQYWGADDGSGVVATNATVTGAGEYTIGLDFTGTASGAASGVAFTAIGIKEGEFNFPNATIELLSVKINGEEITLGKGYTSSDDSITTRMNLYNEWVSELPADARSFDGDLTDASAIVVDKEAFAAVETVEVTFALHTAEDTAYLMYADSSWTYQYWNDGSESDVVATNATVTGAGTYTVGLDFTGTTDGAASGLSFTALGVTTGEQTFPNYCITIDDIKVNGESIAFTKGYTSSDDGVTTRMNIMNEWVTELPSDARSADASLDDAGWIIVDKALFESVQTVEVTFTYSLAASTAYIMYADAAWGVQYWAEPVDGITATDATVTGAGHYSVALDFTGTADGAASGLAFTALGIKNGEVTHPGWFIRIDSIVINGEAVEFTKGYTSSDDGIETRMNIYNEWVTELPTDARSNEGSTDDANWIIVDKTLFDSVQTIQIDFTYIYGEKPVEEAAEEIDVDAALASDYNAYFGIQTETYIFRNSWSEPTYGMGTDNFSHLTGWDADSNQVDYGGTFTDAAITGNGTYTVGVTLGDMALGTDTTLRMLFVSTDIPSELYDQGLVTISDLKTVIDGAKAQTAFTVNTEGDYVQIDILNEYNSAVGTEAIPYSIPTTDVTITFTIAGLTKDAAAAEPEATAEPTAEPVVEEEPVATGLSTGAIAAIAGGAVVVLGGGAAGIVAASKKKKEQ